MSSDILEFSVEQPHGLFRFRVIRLANGLLILVTDTDSFRLGLSAVAVPPPVGSRSPTSMSVLGTGMDLSIVRAIAERIATLTGHTCLVVVGVRHLDLTVMTEIVNSLKMHLGT